MIFDKDFDAPLAAAEVSIAETGETTTASDEGNYVFGQVPPGNYTLVFSKDGYTRQVDADVVVASGQMTDLNASLSGEFTEMEEFVVQDIQIGGNSEEGLLNLRMETPVLMDSVGSDLMSRAGAGDAASALKLVAGATVQDGKYAVVRGLPDRYVVSLMNNVRLPSADPDKRAVQLDQFPSALIESIQVSKTFTPDQQGDASGGAVNVVLKAIPDEPILKFKIGTKYKPSVEDNDFLTYSDGGVNFLGIDDSRNPQVSGTNWSGAVGVSRGAAPTMYDWELTAGGKYELDSGIKVGGLANVYYTHDASTVTDKKDDKYDANVLMSNPVAADGVKTSFFDVDQSTEEVQWGFLGALGLETERNTLTLLYMQTHVAEDTATLAEDTRGKELYFPGYDPYDIDDPGNDRENVNDAVYQRFQTLEYTERDTGTVQLDGKHTIPFPEIGIPGLVTILEPEVDWILSENFSKLGTPDKRMLGTQWTPTYRKGSRIKPALYAPNKPTENTNIGNLQRIWKDVREDSSQFSLNGKVPFQQWSGDSGYIKLGVFNDKVDREFRQDTFSAETLG
ncbi:MAG: carboxypeptidase regulatory-like domain-containing protein [Kiritimatiellales bacterium]